MTIDEAIKHAEEVAEEQKNLYRICPASESGILYCDGTKDCKTLKNGKNKGCQKCAEEYRQLAEWLKDYKRLLGQEHCEDAISRQAAIVALDNRMSSLEKVDMQIAIGFAKGIIHELPSVTPAEKVGCSENPNKWIPVSERLPEIHKDVILSLRSLDIGVGFRAKTEPYFYCYCRGVDSCYIDPKNVLAWMPLPESYK